MATVIDLLRSRGQGAGPKGTQALRGPIAIASQPARAVTIAAPNKLVSGWAALAKRQPEAGHALALAASRRGEAVAFMGYGHVPHDDLLLLTLAQLGEDSAMVVLWLVPDVRSARTVAERCETLSSSHALSWQMVNGRHGRPLPSRVVITTYDDLHQRLLTGADRGWHWLWRRLGLVVVPDLHRASGALGAHVRWLIRRVKRLAANDVRLAGGVAPIAEPEEALGRILGEPVRVVPSVVLNDPALVTLWRTGDRWGAMRLLVAELLARRLSVAVLGRDAHETQELGSHLESLPPQVIALPPEKARIAVVSGVPAELDSRDALFRSGYRLIIMVAGDEPFEAMCAERPDVLVARVPALPVAGDNAYVAGPHLQWAACETPLLPSELALWEAQPLADLLLDRGLLRMVAGGQLQPGDAALEHGLNLLTATIDEPPFEVCDPAGEVVGQLLPHVADWWALPGFPWQPGWTIGEHDSDAKSATLVPASDMAVTLPLLRLELSLREEIGPFPARVGARTLAVTRARVHVKQRIEGQIVYRAGEAPQHLLLERSRLRTWSAHACAIDVPVSPADPQTAGWSLSLALPHVVRLERGDALVAYDAPTHAIWIIETHPGGAGLAACITADVPYLIVTAMELARAALASPVYGALAQTELAWLEALHRPEQPLVSVETEEITPPRSTDPPSLPRPEGTLGTGRAIEDSFATEDGTLRTEIHASLTVTEDDGVGGAERDVQAPISMEEAVPHAQIQASLPLGEDVPLSTLQAPGTPEDERSGDFFEEVVLEELAPQSQQSRENAVPDVQALIARMRRLREQQEQEPASPDTPASAVDVPEPAGRFRRGQRVHCLPYGEGTVEQARIVAGREHLTISFAEAGAIEVDPAVNMVRVLDDPTEQAGPWDPQIF